MAAKNRNMAIIGAALLVAAGVGAYYLTKQETVSDMGGGFAQPGGYGRYLITTEEVAPADTGGYTINIPATPAPEISYPSVSELLTGIMPVTTEPGEVTEPSTKKDMTTAGTVTSIPDTGFGGGGVGARGEVTPVDTGTVSLLERLLGGLTLISPLGPAVVGTKAISAAVGGAATALGGGEAAQASGAVPLTYAGKLTGVEVYGSSGKKSEAVTLTTGGAMSEEVGAYLQAGKEYAGSVPIGTTATGGTIYESTSGARQVVSGGQIVAASSRALDPYDVARMPSSVSTALGYSGGGSAYTPSGQVYSGGKVYSKKAAAAAGLI